MFDELFSRAEARLVRPLPTSQPRCDRCGLFRKCESPKIGVAGQGAKKVCVVGPPPGGSEDSGNTWLAGRDGRWFRGELTRLGVDVERDLWVTGALICAPGKDRPTTAIDDCRPNLLKTIRDLNPEVILLVGQEAVQSLIGHMWKPDVGPVTKWTGRRIPGHKPNAWVCPLNDLDYMTRDKPDVVARMQFREALAAAFQLKGRPWPKGPPNYADRVECVKSPAEAARRLKQYTRGAVAFDYETDRLRPDHKEGRIVCAAVCYNGTETIAFPWHGPAVLEMRRLLTDPNVEKIGYNIAFEHRWTLRMLGVEVSPWKWDGMLASHVMDARKGASGRDDQERGSGTTGLKFQSFVRLGMPDYNGHLDDLLKPARKDGEKPGANDRNRIDEIGIDLTLRYCGTDAILEWEVAQQQMVEMGVS